MIEYGYLMNSGAVYIEHAESIVVIRIFYEYIAAQSAYAVASLLNQESVPSRTKNKKWRSQTVTSILRNRIYCGDGKYPSIVEKSLFDKANRILDENPIRKKTKARLEFNEGDIKYGLVVSEMGETLMRLYCNTENDCYWMVPRDVKYSVENSICGFVYDNDLIEMISILRDSLITNKVKLSEETLFFDSNQIRLGNLDKLYNLNDWKRIVNDFSERYKNIQFICTKQDVLEARESLNTSYTIDEFISRAIKSIVVSKNGTINIVLRNMQIFTYSYNNAKRR